MVGGPCRQLSWRWGLLVPGVFTSHPRDTDRLRLQSAELSLGIRVPQSAGLLVGMISQPITNQSPQGINTRVQSCLPAMAWGTWRIAGRLSPVPKHQEAGSVLHGADHATPTTSFPVSAFSRLGSMSLLQGESLSLRHQAGTIALGSQLAGKTSDVRGEGPSC